jgi:hypothetical protein
MVSSDFGKLDVMRHLISGEDCAIAGEAIAVAAAPAAETFKKSRRFIQASPYWGRSSQISWSFSVRRREYGVVRALWRAVFNTEIRPRNTRQRHDCTD